MFKIKNTTNDLYYKDKYLKYKIKYLNLRKKLNLINNKNHQDLKMIGGSARKKLKKIQQSAIYNQQGMLNADGYCIITLPEPTIGNFNPKVFYETIFRELVVDNCFYENRWDVRYTDTGGLQDNIDIGGYSKALFSHFARYCLYYDKSALNKKKMDLNKMIYGLKKDYYKLCDCFEKKNSVKCAETKFEQLKELKLESPFFKTYIESCNKLKNIQAITKVDDETYLSLSDEEKKMFKPRHFRLKKL